MKKQSILTTAILFTFALCCIVFLLFPIFANASLMQDVSFNNSIKVDVIDSVWLDSNLNEITSIQMPEYVSAGEEIDIGDGLRTKNIGVPGFARFSAKTTLNGAEVEMFEFQILNVWVKGLDGFYYYCGDDGVLDNDEIVLVIEHMRTNKNLTNLNKDDEIRLILSMETVDSSDKEWELQWQNPPQQWLELADRN